MKVRQGRQVASFSQCH